MYMHVHVRKPMQDMYMYMYKLMLPKCSEITLVMNGGYSGTPLKRTPLK